MLAAAALVAVFATLPTSAQAPGAATVAFNDTQGQVSLSFAGDLHATGDHFAQGSNGRQRRRFGLCRVAPIAQDRGDLINEALRKAEESYEELLARPDPEAVQQAELQLSQARNSLWSTQVSRDSTCVATARGDASKAACESANASVANAEITVQLAEISYQQAQTPATAAEIADATAEVQRAKEDLGELRNSPSALELTQAEGRVTQAEYKLTQAQAQLHDLLAGASAEDLTAAQRNVKQVRTSLT